MKTGAERMISMYNICDFGAVGDGKTKNTMAIQTAIDKCAQSGGGTVLMPPGIFLTAPLVLKSNVNLHISEGATLLGSADIEDYKNWTSEKLNTQFAPYNCKYLIIAEDEKNISLTGRGTIAGQGLIYYDRSASGRTWPAFDRNERPGRMIMFALCQNVLVEGLTFVDSPAWTLWAIGCDQIKFDKINIINHFKAINTDGVDIDCCTDATISNSYFHTGDDCIVVRAIDRILKERKPCENVTVTNCTLESNCNAIRLSYIGDGIIRNCVFSNLTITKSFRGIIFQIPASAGVPRNDQEQAIIRQAIEHYNVPVVENILFSNIVNQAHQPIWIYLQDGAVAKAIRNIHFSDMEMRGSSASVVKGTTEMLPENITFSNIRVEVEPEETVYSDEAALAFYCENARDISFTNIRVSGENSAKADEPLIRCVNVDELEVKGLKNRTAHESLRED